MRDKIIKEYHIFWLTHKVHDLVPVSFLPSLIQSQLSVCFSNTKVKKWIFTRYKNTVIKKNAWAHCEKKIENFPCVQRNCFVLNRIKWRPLQQQRPQHQHPIAEISDDMCEVQQQQVLLNCCRTVVIVYCNAFDVYQVKN